MAVAELSKNLRLILESSPEAPSLPHLLQDVDAFVSSGNADSDVLAQLEVELQEICRDAIDHSIYYSQIKVLLAVLYHLLPILPPSSIISTWFDLVLRSALREPKLPQEAVNHAKEIILDALNPASQTDEEAQREAEQELEKEKEVKKVRDFRRRLMDLYLLDAYNESSGDDVLEWAAEGDAQKERIACWKANLEDVLVRLGLVRPQDLLTEIYYCFTTPQHRLQLLILLNSYTSQLDFPTHAAAFASHPLVQSLHYALILDSSSTECTVATTVLTKLLPIFAVKACEHLKRFLPSLFVVLARIVCWEARHPYTLPELAADAQRGGQDVLVEPVIEDKRDEFVSDNSSSLRVRPELDWNTLDQTFTGSTSSAPPRQQYFAFLYYLFPCNTIRFLRGPVSYLNQSPLESPYTVSWDQALDEDKIRSKSEVLLRGHTLHPLLIWRDAADELAKPDFWADYEISRIVSECSMLDVRAASVGLREQLLADTSTLSTGVKYPVPESQVPEPAVLSSSVESASSVLDNMQSEQPSRLRISLQEMIATSIALKSGLDVEVMDAPTTAAWTTTLAEHATRARSPSRGSMASASIRSPSPTPIPTHSRSASAEEGVPPNVALAIAGLQREVLVLRCELNFELWMARENVKHIGRLYQDRVLSRTAEVERQGLHNRLREYKSEVYRLQKDLKEQKEQALNVKNQYADWNKKLQDKIRDFKTEKSDWLSEAAALRAADKETKATFAAQDKLLSDANREVFELQTKIKANQPKVDRLHDYERQIAQLVQLQRLWETDVQKLNDQTEFLLVCSSRYKKMELRVTTHEEAEARLEDLTQVQQQQIQSLQAQLSIAQRQLGVSRKVMSAGNLTSYQNEKNRLTEMNSRLREDNTELREELEELKAMIELLKGQVSGRQSLVSDPRASPFLGPSLSLH